MALEKVAPSDTLAAILKKPVMPTSKTLNSLWNFPLRYRGLSLAKCAENPTNYEALAAAKSWADGKIDNLMFYGLNGTGKTHIACSAMAERYGTPEFISVPIMLLKFQASVHDHDELDLIAEHSGYRQLPNGVAMPLRLFDDVAAHRISDFGIEMFGILLEKLYSNCTAGIIFTSNLSPKQILETMGERIASRLHGLAKPIKIDGNDWRLKAHKNFPVDAELERQKDQMS